ncbi:hypothetical protein ACHHYP_02566 [Achlya hypogyna]|uniref:Uncharacterized protein n=1 Tax=Achlya hypogyna TaxID=1202772 RepID=A0A1V9Z5Z7_ACHHY|nr:hypothetical protein ACHHYP_02566 [Achlya hypogyna]
MQKKPRLQPSQRDAPDGVCNLSGRELTDESSARALVGFREAARIDLSRNQLSTFAHSRKARNVRVAMVPTAFGSSIIALNLAFNSLCDIQAVASLPQLQVLDLSYNRLYSVDALLYCTQLTTIKLQGNRLLSSKGIEGLKQLKLLDLSENVIEEPDAIRGLSLNVALQSLALEGNPIASLKDYRVYVLDLTAEAFEDTNEVTAPRPHYIAPSIPPKSYAAIKAEQKVQLKKKLTPKKEVDAGALYVSLFDRLAVANGVPEREALPRPPSSSQARVKSGRSKSTTSAAKPTSGKRKIVISPPKDKVHPMAAPPYARRQLNFDETPEPPKETLNPSQMRVLDVIQSLIQHKRQTIAALNSSLGG